jgi:TolB protein
MDYRNSDFALRRPAIAFRLLLPLMALLALTTGCGIFDDDEFITYAVGSEGERNIVVVRADGGDRRVIIANPGDDFAPVWSPDRDRIAFLSDRDGNVEIYVSPADGSTAMRITNTGVDESQPTWSPDGTRLAYTSPDGDGNPRVFWVRLDDLLPNRLLFGSASEADPAWSPSGTWVAFASLNEQGESVGLFLRNPDGVNRLQLTQSPDRSPVWSPDGKKLAFVSERDGNEEIYVIKVGDDGPEGQAIPITANPARDFAPEWSPNSKRVAFISDRNGGQDIFIVSDKGEDLRSLTRNETEEISLSWGKNGKIVFESRPSGKSDLFISNTGSDAGGSQRQISVGDMPSTQPDW